MRNWLFKRVDLTPERIALQTDEAVWTFAELKEDVVTLAGRLASCGVNHGDFIAVLMKNDSHVVKLIHAIQLLGAVIVPINTKLSPAEVSWQIRDAGISLLLYDTTTTDCADMLKEDLAAEHILAYSQLQHYPVTETALKTTVDLDELQCVIYTSGTTGAPKGVELTYGNHWWSAVGSALNIGLTANDTWLCVVPMFHVSGLSIVMRSVIYGMTMRLQPSFSAAKVNETIKREHITMMSVVTTMLTAIVENIGTEHYPDRFRCMLLGGGPAPRFLLEKAYDAGIPVFQSYGLTESASQIVTLSPEDSFRKIGSAGKPLFPAELRIVSSEAAGEQQQPGKPGDIYLRGPNLAQGYLHRPDATAAAYDGDWFITGDVGYLDEEGFLYVLDRRKDLIISGGENIYPAEVEAVLQQHEAVTDAGVTSRSDARWGERPVAFVSLSHTVSEATLLQFCREHLAHYKVPDTVYVVDTLPRNASQKLLRRELQRLLPTDESL